MDAGIEIEALYPNLGDRSAVETIRKRALSELGNNLASTIRDFGVPCTFERYNHDVSNAWKIVTDSSLSHPEDGAYLGLEAVSPVLIGEESLNVLDPLCMALKSAGAKVNRSCGLHNHVGAKTMSLHAMKRLVKLFITNEDVIDGLLPPWRRGDSSYYCKSLKSTNIDALDAATDVMGIARAIRTTSHDPSKPSRYVKLNFCSHWRHGTVEFRQHSGTIDPEKIKRWAVFVSKMVDVASNEAIDLPGPTSAAPSASLEKRIARAKQLRIIYTMVCRPEGCTSVEAQEALGRRTAPALASDLQRLGVEYRTAGRRNGHVVYKLEQAPTVMTTATLDSLLRTLDLSASDNEFWRARAALLRSVHGGGHNPNFSPEFD